MGAHAKRLILGALNARHTTLRFGEGEVSRAVPVSGTGRKRGFHWVPREEWSDGVFGGPVFALCRWVCVGWLGIVLRVCVEWFGG